MIKSTKPTQVLYNKYRNVFTGFGCFKGMFSLQVKEVAKPYQAPP